MFTKFLEKMAHDVYWGIGNTDNPKCPDCKEVMTFHGGDRAYGEGYWDCSCGYSFTEEDLDEYEVD